MHIPPNFVTCLLCTSRYKTRLFALEPFINIQENLCCSLWSFYSDIPLISPLTCMFVCFDISHETRSLVLEPLLNIQDILAWSFSSFCVFTPDFAICLLLNLSLWNEIACIRTSCQHTRKSCCFLVIILHVWFCHSIARVLALVLLVMKWDCLC